MVTYTTTYNLKKPTVGQDDDLWGGYANDTYDLIDDLLDGTTPVTGIDINSGTIDNAVIGGTTPVAGTFTTLTANTSLGVTGNITVSGTVDGRDVAADGTKLDGIEAGAEVNVATNLGNAHTSSNVQITSSTGTNTVINAASTSFAGVMLPTDKSKLDGIESGATADQTKADIDALGINAATLDSLDSTQFLRSDATDTVTGTIYYNDGPYFYGTSYWRVSSSDAALQRADARDESTNYSRLHWYGETDAGSTSNFRHAWYDGSAYINVTATSGGVDFTGSATHMTIGGNTVWHSGNDGSGSGLDADNLDGRTWSTTRNAANTIVTRDANGYTQLGWINTSSGSTTSTINKIYASYDDYIRYVTPATLISQLGLHVNSYSNDMTANIAYADNWFRSVGNTGWYSNSYGGGIYMTDSTWVRVYNYKQFLVENKARAYSWQENYTAKSGTSVTIDADTSGAFSLSMSGNTTFTFSGVDSGISVGFVLQLTGNGSTVTWPSSVDWAGGTAPDAPASGETDIYVFWTRDGGTTWYGVQSIDAAA